MGLLNEKEYTTNSLGINQYLKLSTDCNLGETFCYGYTNGEYDEKITGWYMNNQLFEKI